MSVTIKDISKRLGISVSTVSKALNNYPDVSQDTRKLVLDTALALNYHPNTTAQNLRRRKTKKIGLLINYRIALIGEYFSRVVTGAALAAERAGYNLILYTTVGDQLSELTRICRAREVDGLLVMWARQMDDTVALMEREEIPFVAVSRRVSKHNVSYVVPDNEGGALALTRHLLALGHRRIGFTPWADIRETSTDRLAGYRQALEEYGIPFDEKLLIPIQLSPESRYEALNQLMDLSNPPTAIFALHDYVAIEMLRAALDRGLRVPKDVAIAGFDGMHTTMVTSPPLTTVIQPIEAIGEKALDVLLSVMENRIAQQIVLPVKLLPRASTTGEISKPAAVTQ